MKTQNNVTAQKSATNAQFPQYQAWKIYRNGTLIGEIAVLKHLTAVQAIEEYFA